MRRLRQRTSRGSVLSPTPCTCRAMKPRGVMPSCRSAAGTPLSQVLIESPRHSTRNLFHSFWFEGLRAGSLFFKSLSQPRRPSS